MLKFPEVLVTAKPPSSVDFFLEDAEAAVECSLCVARGSFFFDDDLLDDGVYLILRRPPPAVLLLVAEDGAAALLPGVDTGVCGANRLLLKFNLREELAVPLAEGVFK